MRPIKFRAWNEVLKEWVEPNAVHVNGVGILGFVGAIDGRFHQASPHYKFSQFTSLHDKNGKEIWEGDVLRAGDESGMEVKFEKGAFGVEPLRPQSDENGTEYYETWVTLDQLIEENYWSKETPSFDVEVLGNIYENPELLK